ncbi:MAG: molybdopterin-dependent oxidoreductase [Anaerolineae bacterium]|nr:molybdopterin-dependent oxidoreductase [Anaerolineae bacterium]
MRRLSRRGFLIAITGSAIAVAAGCRPTTSSPAPTAYAPGSSLGTPMATATSGGTAIATAPDPKFGQLVYDKRQYTAVPDLYITQYDYSNTPQVDQEAWMLTVDGLVETPLTINYADLLKLPSFEDTRTLECISDPPNGTLMGNLQLKGIDMKTLLDKAKVKPEATHVRFEAADGYSTSVELRWITQPNVMLAYEMNGEPLNATHGFPLRIFTPGLYGQKMPRWITRIEFIDYDYTGFWESRGWSNVAEIKTKSVIRMPDDRDEVQAGSIAYLQGVAVAGKRKITGVEVQIDDGEWQPAELYPGESSLEWTQWSFEWNVPAPGSYRIGVRATDDTGFVQSSEADGLFGNAYPNGTDAIHRLVIKSV